MFCVTAPSICYPQDAQRSGGNVGEVKTARIPHGYSIIAIWRTMYILMRAMPFCGCVEGMGAEAGKGAEGGCWCQKWAHEESWGAHSCSGLLGLQSRCSPCWWESVSMRVWRRYSYVTPYSRSNPILARPEVLHTRSPRITCRKQRLSQYLVLCCNLVVLKKTKSTLPALSDFGRG